MKNKKRFRDSTYRNIIVNSQLYNEWIESFPEYKDKTLKEFKKYIEIILDGYKSEVITNPDGVRLPFYMGDIAIKYVPIKIKPVDYIKSKLVNKDVPFLNLSTNGKIAKVVWSVDHARKFNKFIPLMGFQGDRGLHRDAKMQLIENPEIYKQNVRSKANRLYNNI